MLWKASESAFQNSVATSVWGDRIALRTFCQKRAKSVTAAHNVSSGSASHVQERRLECFGSIKKKMKLPDRDSQPTVSSLSESEDTADDHQLLRSQKLSGNRNAAKSTRKIQYGWIHNGKGVRTTNGGGTRDSIVQKTVTCNDLLSQAKSLFFPNGKSRTGIRSSLCTFELRDFSHCKMSESMTVGEMCEAVRMSGLLRFYLCSKGPPINKQNMDGPPHDDTNSAQIDIHDRTLVVRGSGGNSETPAGTPHLWEMSQALAKHHPMLVSQLGQVKHQLRQAHLTQMSQSTA